MRNPKETYNKRTTENGKLQSRDPDVIKALALLGEHFVELYGCVIAHFDKKVLPPDGQILLYPSYDGAEIDIEVIADNGIEHIKWKAEPWDNKMKDISRELAAIWKGDAIL